MSELPDLAHSAPPAAGEDKSWLLGALALEPTMTYNQARAVPGAIYDPVSKGMMLPTPTPRSAIVALTMKPALANVYPELVELRDQLLVEVRPTDYATPLQIKINAPVVHQSLLDQGHDWLEFEDVVPFKSLERDERGASIITYKHATQETDLGYAAAMLQKEHGFYLGWARGYGKTLGFAAIVEANDYRLAVAVVPNSSKVDTWVRELEVRLPSHRLLVLPNEKTKREQLLDKLRGEADLERHGERMMPPTVLIVHHESARIVAQWRGPENRRRTDGPDLSYGGWRKLYIDWDLVAIDEGHRLANKETKLHRGVRNIPRKNTLILSGSVYQNNWEELFGPLNIMLPNVYARKWDDWNLRHFEYVEGGYSKTFAGIIDGHEQQMRDEIGVFLIVREKPDKTIKRTVMLDLSSAQRYAYDELAADFMTMLDDGTAVAAQSGIVMLQKLRQIASGLDLLSDQLVDSTKLDEIVNDIQYYGLARGDDFFVAGWYKASLRALVKRLEGVGIHPYLITGDVKPADRGPIIEAARHAAMLRGGEGLLPPVVLIGTIPTLGESVNLQFLNHVMRLDRSFNPALNRQVVDRVDRTGQLRLPYLTDYIARDTVDELVVLPSLANKDAVRALLLGRPA